MHVPHDERGAHRHRHGGNHAGPGRLLRQPGLRQNAAAGPPGTGQHQRRRQCRQGRQPAAGAADPACGHQAHAACAKELLRGRAGAQPVLRAAGGRGPHGRAAGGAGREAAAGGVDPHRQELAQRVLPGGQQPGDPDSRRLRLHARLPRGAVLARQPPEHDPRGHARHPGRRPAGPPVHDRRPGGARAAARAHPGLPDRQLAFPADARTFRDLRYLGARRLRATVAVGVELRHAPDRAGRGAAAGSPPVRFPGRPVRPPHRGRVRRQAA